MRALIFGFGVSWTVVSGSGNIADTDNPATIISDLPIGTNEFSWCISNGVCPNASTCDTIQIDVFDQFAPIAFAGDDQDWCDPVTSIFMTATAPAAPGVGTWTEIGGLTSIVDMNDPLTEITGFGVGEYTFLWKSYNWTM